MNIVTTTNEEVVILQPRQIWKDWNTLRKNTLKPYYQTYIKDICWSPCGTYLVSCDTQHQLTIWNTTNITTTTSKKEQPTKVQYTKNVPIFHQLQFYTSNDRLYLICASTMGIYFYNWKTLLSSSSSTTMLEEPLFALTSSSSLMEQSQFCIVANLCIATGRNGQVLLWDIATQQLQSIISQNHFSSLSTIHSLDSPHQIILTGCPTTTNNGTTVMASIWDVSQSKLMDTISTTSTTSSSSTINCMAWDKSDWMVGGGNGFLATIHLPTRTMNSCRKTRESISNVILYNHTIYSVGNEGVISSWDTTTHLSSSSSPNRAWLSTPSATTLASSSNNNSLVVGGKGTSLDWFIIPPHTTTSFGTKSHILTL